MPSDITLYASGRVAVLSTKLFGKEKFNRLAEAASLEAALKVLYESNYAGGTTVENPNDFEFLLKKELGLALDFFRKMSPDKFVTDCFTLEYDYANAKILQKARRMGIDAKEKTYDCGEIDVGEMTDAVDSINYDEMPEIMREAFSKIDEAFMQGTGTPQLIDTVLDKAKFKQILNNLKRTKSGAVREYFAAEIDMKNVLTAFRCLSIHFDVERFQEMFIDGGSLAENEILSEYEKGPDALLAYVSETPYKKLGEICAEAIRADKPLVAAEIYRADIIRKILVPFKNDMETVYPLLDYFMSKKTEIENVRWILVCVKNGVREDIIKSRIKELYV